MQAKKAAELLQAWGDKPCSHPAVEKLGAHTGVEACTQCGRIVERDRQGRPIPHPGGSDASRTRPSQI